MVGYATTEGIQRGSVDGTEWTYAIDQFESQGEWQVFRYMLSLMQSGKARVDNAAKPFTVRSLATFVVLANSSPQATPQKSFAFMVQHMAREPNFARRFGIILFDKGAKQFDRNLSESEKMKWATLFEFFRAVERAARPKILALWKNERVWDWLNEKPIAWIDSVCQISDSLKKDTDEDVQKLGEFLGEFIAHGWPHTRGAALNAAVAENLGQILAADPDIEELLSDAENVFSQLQAINEKSLRNITANFKQDRLATQRAYFESLPAYMKEIVYAVLYFAKSNSLEVGSKINLKDAADRDRAGNYFSGSIKLARRGNPEGFNEDLKAKFGLELQKDDGTVNAVIWDKRDIWDNLDILSNMGVSKKIENPSLEEDQRLDNSQEKGRSGETSPGQNHVPNVPDSPDVPELFVCRCGAGPYKGPSDKVWRDHKELTGHSELREYHP